MNKKRTTLALGVLLIVVSIVSLVFATLWIIDSTTHYITITPVEAYIQYSLDNVAWANITSTTGNTPWYARLRLNYVGAPRNVSITWQLWTPEQSWSTPPLSPTVITLNVGWNDIYVSSSGIPTNNYNWGLLTNPTSEFAYRVRATISAV